MSDDEDVPFWDPQGWPEWVPTASKDKRVGKKDPLEQLSATLVKWFIIGSAGIFALCLLIAVVQFIGVVSIFIGTGIFIVLTGFILNFLYVELVDRNS